MRISDWSSDVCSSDLRAAADHAEQAGGHGGDLGGTAGAAAAEPHGEVHEGLATAGEQQHAAEQDEGADGGAGHADQQAPDAEVAEQQGLGGEIDVEAAMAERQCTLPARANT